MRKHESMAGPWGSKPDFFPHELLYLRNDCVDCALVEMQTALAQLKRWHLSFILESK